MTKAWRNRFTNTSFIRATFKGAARNWIHTIVVFFVSLLGGAAVLTWVRNNPESLHKHLAELNSWIRIGFGVGLSSLAAWVTVRLMKPHLAQLRHFVTHPPAWLAVVAAVLVIALFDLTGYLAPHAKVPGYAPTPTDWLLYGAIPILTVAWSNGFFAGAGAKEESRFPAANADRRTATHRNDLATIDSLAHAPWEDIEAWLDSDEVANCDLLGHRPIATRLSGLIKNDTRAIGIAGPYGAGKSTIVNWIQEDLRNELPERRRSLLVPFSCWGFDTADAAVAHMLTKAVELVGKDIDTFSIASLPQSYRNTFTAGREWIARLLDTVLDHENPEDGFRRLSGLLGQINARLVFIVEDLDRSATTKFEIQAVMAFLNRIKPIEHLSFVLTGGMQEGTRHIDFAKLCDHIEILGRITSDSCAAVINRVSQRCADTDVFPHVSLSSDRDQARWKPGIDWPAAGIEGRPHQEVIATLLGTPRALRHSLRISYDTWNSIPGEVNLSQLITLDAIRVGAPEAFDFLIQRSHQLRVSPTGPGMNSRKEKLERILSEEWQTIATNAEWDPPAAIRAITCIFPAADAWIAGGREVRFSNAQSLDEEKYWKRAVNQCLAPDEVGDQSVLNHVARWKLSEGNDTTVIDELTNDASYCETWRSLVRQIPLIPPSDCLIFAEKTISRATEKSAASTNRDSPGVLEAFDLVRQSGTQPSARQQWLIQRLQRAAAISLRLTSDLWHWRTSLVPEPEIDWPSIRNIMIDSVRRHIDSGGSLSTLLDPGYPYTLFHLIFDSGADNRNLEAILEDWGWLSEPVWEALRNGSESMACATEVLLAERQNGSRTANAPANTNLFWSFFGTRSDDAINHLESIEFSDESQQARIRAFARSARRSSH